MDVVEIRWNQSRSSPAARECGAAASRGGGTSAGWQGRAAKRDYVEKGSGFPCVEEEDQKRQMAKDR